MVLDNRSLLVKADTENDMAEIIAYISGNRKMDAVNKLFDIGRANCVIDDDFKFNRDELYER